MKPMDGLEFTRRVRNDEHSPNPFVPIIMITGHTEKYRVEAARDAGVTEFLAKPITAQNLFIRASPKSWSGRAPLCAATIISVPIAGASALTIMPAPGAARTISSRKWMCADEDHPEKTAPDHPAGRLSADDEQAECGARHNDPALRTQDAVERRPRDRWRPDHGIARRRADYVDELETAPGDMTLVFEKAHEIRGFAETAGLVATGRIADGLCRYIDEMERGQRAARWTLWRCMFRPSSAPRAPRMSDATMGDVVAEELGRAGRPQAAE